jgi:hypothetical protein
MHESAKAASRIGNLHRPIRPGKLSPEQTQQVFYDKAPKILERAAVRDQLRAQIEAEFGVAKMAAGRRTDPSRTPGRGTTAQLNSTVRAEERALLKRI